MAAADYYLCDMCGRKTFYDTAVEYGDRVGGMVVICDECAKTHEVRAVPKVRDAAIEELVEAAEDAKKTMDILWKYITPQMSLDASNAGLLFARIDLEKALAAYKAVQG